MILLALSAFFSSAETALTSANKIRMKNLAEEGNYNAKTVLKILDNQSKMLSTVLIGNNIVNLSASAVATVFCTELFGNAYIGLGTGILTLLVLLFGEITPKTAATIHADKIALVYAKYIGLLMKIFTPVVWIVGLLSKGVMKLLRIDPTKEKEIITEEELRTMVDMSHEEGVIETDEKQMITNVFDFGDQTAKDIMVPRVDMTVVDVEDSYDDVLAVFKTELYSRLPVYEDDTDNIIGVLNLKDMMRVENKDEFSIRKLMREPLYTYEYKKVSKLITEMRKSTANVIIVLNEYGSTVGMITLEDMLEELVGEIRDEYDDDEDEDFVCLSENAFLIDGAMKLNDINERLGLELYSEDFDSLGGYVTGLLNHFPDTGEKVSDGDLLFIIDRADKTRVEKVKLILPDKKTKNSSDRQNIE
ncbi:MAG: HlyC/CorC family transporter [Candidatus Avilachnospira sp.]